MMIRAIVIIGILKGSTVYGQNEIYEEVSGLLYYETGLFNERTLRDS